MRDPYERIAAGPFLDDTHQAAVEAAAVDLAPGPLRQPQAAVSGGKASQVHSGSNAAQRASGGLGEPAELRTRSRRGRHTVEIRYASEAEADEAARWIAARMYALAAIKAVREVM